MQKIFVLAVFLLFSVVLCYAQPESTNNFRKVSWVFSEKDFNTKIREERIKGNHASEIIRQASSEREKLLIRKAEALYPHESDLEVKKLYNSEYDPNEFDKDAYVSGHKPAIEEKPFWSANSFDGVKIARVISTRALNYYQELSSAFRNKKNITSIKMSKTSLNYLATIQNYDKYEIAGEKFENINLVILKLGWSQYCGNLCAMGFDQRKLVVFNKSDEPIAMFIVEGGGWVS